MEYLLQTCPSSSSSVNLKAIPNFCDDTQFRYPHCRFNAFCCVTKLFLHLLTEICVYMWYDIPIMIRCMVMLHSFFQPQTKKVMLTQPECDVIYTFTKDQRQGRVKFAASFSLGVTFFARRYDTQVERFW